MNAMTALAEYAKALEPSAQDHAFAAIRAVKARRWADARHCARRSGSAVIIEAVSELHEAST